MKNQNIPIATPRSRQTIRIDRGAGVIKPGKHAGGWRPKKDRNRR